MVHPYGVPDFKRPRFGGVVFFSFLRYFTEHIMLYSPKEAARLTGVALTSINNFLQRSRDIITAPAGNGRPRFDKRGLRILALMRELTGHGISPNVAAFQAATVVDRAKDGSRIAVFARDAKVSPRLIPDEGMPDSDAVLMISLGPIFCRIDEAIRA